MRDHNTTAEHETSDNVLFWPIVQLLVVGLARDMLQEALNRQSTSDVAARLDSSAAARALSPLNQINWNAHCPPWRYLLLVRSERNSWRITNEDRKGRLRVAERILRWQLGLDSLTEDDITGENGLRGTWEALLPLEASSEVDDMWAKIEERLLP